LAILRWAGGATAQAQVSTLTPGGTIEAGDIFNVVLTGEDGVAQTEAVVATGTTVAQVCDDIVLQCSASTQTLFRRVTFTDQTSRVDVSANAPGVPFYLTETTTETGGGTADDQTFAVGATTASAGPNDYNTLANWVESDGTAPSAIPASNDEVYFSTGSHDVLYGLNQSGVDLKQFRVTSGYQGAIGQADIPLKVNVSNVSDSVMPYLALGSSGRRINIEGTFDQVVVTRNSGTIDIKVTDVDIFTIVGTASKGLIRIKNGSSFLASGSGGTGLFRQTGVDGLTTIIESGVSAILQMRIDGGYVETSSSVGAANADELNVHRGTVCFKGSAACKTVNVFGGTLRWQSDQHIGSSTNTPVTIFNGIVDVTKNTRVGSLNVYTPTVFNGTLDISAETSNVAMSSPDSQQATVYFGEVIYPRVAGQTSGTTKNNNRNLI
jgi:hypothetical protein